MNLSIYPKSTSVLQCLCRSLIFTFVAILTLDNKLRLHFLRVNVCFRDYVDYLHVVISLVEM